MRRTFLLYGLPHENPQEKKKKKSKQTPTEELSTNHLLYNNTTLLKNCQGHEKQGKSE